MHCVQRSLIVCGVGKSGLIGRKIAATLTSTGTPATFLHPVDSVHGDLGIVGNEDVAILISKSGESDELLALVAHLKGFGVRTIAITGDSELRSRAALRRRSRRERQGGGLSARPRSDDEHHGRARPRRRPGGRAPSGEGVPPRGLRSNPPWGCPGARSHHQGRRDHAPRPASYASRRRHDAGGNRHDCGAPRHRSGRRRTNTRRWGTDCGRSQPPRRAQRGFLVGTGSRRDDAYAEAGSQLASWQARSSIAWSNTVSWQCLSSTIERSWSASCICTTSCGRASV